jgi:hypothetical protein
MQGIDKFIEDNFSSYLSLPNENVFIGKRQHWFTLVPLFFFLFFLTVIFVIGQYVLLFFFLQHITIFIISASFTLIASILIAIHVYIKWFYHFYIVTNRKILEVQYIPFTSYMTYDVLLDQVKCTEVDVSTEGLVNHLFDIGTVSITFDRPTHQQEFKCINIKHYQQVGTFLSTHLIAPLNAHKTTPVWFRSNDESKGLIFTEEIFKSKNRAI